MEQWSQAWHWRQSSDEYASRVIDEEGAVTDSSPCLKRAPSRDGRQEAELSYTQCKLQAGFDGGPGGRLTEPREAPGPPFYSARGSLETPMANPPPPDPTSHRVIEKRRRDRMNNCLVNLSHLVPSCHQRKGRGRIEKTEIIEHAIKHIRDLQEQLARLPAAEPNGGGGGGGGGGSEAGSSSSGGSRAAAAAAISSHYEEGYRECLREAMQWMVEHEGFIPGDPICARLMNHLHEHIELVLKGGFPPRPHHMSSNSSAGCYTGNTSGYDGSTSSAAGTASSAAGSSSEGVGGAGSGAQWPGSASNSASPPEMPQSQDLVPMSAPTIESSMSPADAGATSRYPDSEPPQFDQARLYQLLHKSSEAKRAHPPSSSSSRSSEESAGFMYKFKTSMKKRFSADMGDESGPKRCRRPPPPSGDRKPAPAALAAAAAAAARSQQVPVFALHSRGPLYLPMTVHVEALGSQAELLTAEPHSVVHPVNISVCFCGGRRPPSAPPASDEPPSTSGVSSLRTETVGSDELNSGS
ncbi:uncharacterized protein LOC122386475 isoform X2 [Amphibalanus amphitrite]|uniref:uncharacterized protein LOC122386475 isoform X2 n=1 Tax=Amphibalanus amphitrite TaxID=1232801 RepID=UPI001C8FBDDA|nr:uncharacterized protein LOC122386475 isoform X2 [Amphibalanus amphitrite]